MAQIKHCIKVILGFFLSVFYLRKKNEAYWLVWGHIGEAVYALSLIHEFKRTRGIDKVHILVDRPYEQIVQLYRDEVVDAAGIGVKRISCMAEYANSHLCFHKNLYGHSWYWDKNEFYADLPATTYIPGFIYKVRDLGIPYSTTHQDISNPIEDDDETLQEIIRSNAIVKGKSVLLIPYARSAKMMNNRNWEKLANTIRAQGYEVYTNVKNDSDTIIEGTKAICVPLKYIIAVVNYMGSAVSIRCGLTDLLAVGDCDCETIYVVENEIDKALALIWMTKLGVNNMLNKKKWCITTEDDVQKMLNGIESKYEKMIAVGGVK